MSGLNKLYNQQKALLSGREYIGIDNIDGPIIMVRNTHPVGYRDLVECVDAGGRVRMGIVLDTSVDAVAVQIFEGTSGLTLPGTRVRFRGEPLTIEVTDRMLGRVFNGLGKPIDGGPVPLGSAEMDVNGLPINPTEHWHRRKHLKKESLR